MAAFPLISTGGMAIQLKRLQKKQCILSSDSLSGFRIRLVWLSGHCSMTGHW